jgi:hypothetical protein
MTDAEYRAAPGLSYSALKHLAVSALRFWFHEINPEAPAVEPSPEMRFGSAVHAAILEPEEFDNRYACELIAPEGCLHTMDDLRGFLRDAGVTPKGTRKADVASQVRGISPSVPIYDELLEQHARQHEGKVIFKQEDWARIQGCRDSLMQEPKVVEMLREGQAEQPIFTTDKQTGVPLKGKLDWVAPTFTLDLKTFKQRSSKSIDKSIADDIYWFGYHRQFYMYHLLRGWPEWQGDFVLAMVESEAPFEVRIKILRPKLAGQPSLYFEKARIEIRGLIDTYAYCMKEFGTKPWRHAAEPVALMDEDLPGLAFSWGG